MKSSELKKLLEEYVNSENQDDGIKLSSIETLDQCITLLSDPHTSNGIRRGTFEKALGFIEEIQDPRVCWSYEKDLQNRCEPAIRDLLDAFVAKSAKLISAVNYKKVPDWFLELLQNRKVIPPGYRELVRKHAEELKNSLNNGDNPTEICSRTYEAPVPPPQGEHPYKKGGPLGDSHPCMRY